MGRREGAGGSRLILSAWMILAACGCKREPFVGEVSRSRYFEYHEQEGSTHCPEVLPLLDQYAEVLGGLMQRPPRPEDGLTRYYHFRDATSFGPSQPVGYCSDEAVFSSYAAERHELAHAVANRTLGAGSSLMIAEGLAVSLSCTPGANRDYQNDGTSPDLPTLLSKPSVISWRDILDLHGGRDDTPRRGYALAGFFVSRLVERFGWPKMAELCNHALQGIGASDFEVEFARIYPTSVDEAWQEMSTATEPRRCFRNWLCWGQPLLVGQKVDVECDGGLHRTLIVDDQAGDQKGAVVTFLGDSIDGVYLWKDCLNDQRPSFRLTNSFGWSDLPNDNWIVLPPGRYSFTHQEPKEGPPWEIRDFQLLSYLTAPLLGSSCESAGEMRLDPERNTTMHFTSGSLTGWTRLVGGGGLSYGVIPFGLAAETEYKTTIAGNEPRILALCNACGSGASCVPIRHSNGLTVNEGAFLYFKNVTADAYYYWPTLTFRPPRRVSQP